MDRTDDHGEFAGGTSKEAEALDRTLDARVRGNRRKARRLDRDMRETIDRLYVLADVAGLGGGRAELAPPVDVAPWRTRLPLRQAVSALTLVAAVVIIAIGINATVPGFPRGNGAYGTMVVTPTTDRDDARQVLPLTSADCDATPRSRDEVLAILAQAPAGEPLATRETAPVPADAATIEALDHTLRSWQACWRYGDIWHVMALEAERFIRVDVYGGEDVYEPYSIATLEEILAGKEVTHARRQDQGDGPGRAGAPAVTIDRDREVMLSEGGTIGHAWVVRDGQAAGEVIMVLEDGSWKIWYASLDYLQ